MIYKGETKIQIEAPGEVLRLAPGDHIDLAELHPAIAAALAERDDIVDDAAPDANAEEEE